MASAHFTFLGIDCTSSRAARRRKQYAADIVCGTIHTRRKAATKRDAKRREKTHARNGSKQGTRKEHLEASPPATTAPTTEAATPARRSPETTAAAGRTPAEATAATRTRTSTETTPAARRTTTAASAATALLNTTRLDLGLWGLRQEALERKQLVGRNEHLLRRVERRRHHARLQLHRKMHIGHGPKDFLDLPNLSLVLEVNRGVKVGDLVIGRLAHHFALARVLKHAHLNDGLRRPHGLLRPAKSAATTAAPSTEATAPTTGTPSAAAAIFKATHAHFPSLKRPTALHERSAIGRVPMYSALI
eukprot:Opistho-1_new@44997